MKAIELLKKLQKLSPAELQYEVSTEGCDCDGDCAKVEVQHCKPDGPNFIYLRRSTRAEVDAIKLTDAALVKTRRSRP